MSNPNSEFIKVCKCGNTATRKCGACKTQRYCSEKCQKDDWKNHKECCKIARNEPQCRECMKVMETSLKHVLREDITINKHLFTITKGKWLVIQYVGGEEDCSEEFLKEAIRKIVIRHADPAPPSIADLLYFMKLHEKVQQWVGTKKEIMSAMIRADPMKDDLPEERVIVLSSTPNDGECLVRYVILDAIGK